MAGIGRLLIARHIDPISTKGIRLMSPSVIA